MYFCEVSTMYRVTQKRKPTSIMHIYYIFKVGIKLKAVLESCDIYKTTQKMSHGQLQYIFQYSWSKFGDYT